jgi:calcineurin-like phosphoesterase family protein
MANVWFCSDLHFGHKNIQKYRNSCVSEEDNRNQIVADWEKVVTKRDDVYVLGDACFSMDTIKTFQTLPGRKFLIRGNHDTLDTQVYLQVFKSVYGLWKYKEFWLSHAPIHPQELRGRINLHGHVHYNSVPDKRYFNCCVENLLATVNRSLISLDEIRKLHGS